jgi:hypothetical protein
MCRCFFLISIFAIACTPKDNSEVTESALRDLVGTYYIATVEGEDIIVSENCQTVAPDQFIIEKSREKYIFIMNGFHSESYLVLSAKQGRDFITVTALDENFLDDREEMDVSKAIILTLEVEDPLVQLKTPSTEFLLVSKDKTYEFQYRSCQEHDEEHDHANDEPVDSEEPIPAVNYIVDLTHKELYKLLDPTQLYQGPFIDEHILTLLTPGPGLHPIETKIENASDLIVAVKKYLFTYSAAYISNWKQNNFFYYDEPDPCAPDRVGIFTQLYGINGQFTSARIFIVDSGENMATQLVGRFTFVWDENENFILTQIDLTDCGA